MEDSGSSPSGVTGEPVDITGLSFTATYDDGTTGSVVPSSYTPTSFGDTAGTQTVTFSFEGTDITVDVDYDVAAPAPVLTGLSISGDWTNTNQYVNRNVDTTGLTINALYSDGTTSSLADAGLTFYGVHQGLGQVDYERDTWVNEVASDGEVILVAKDTNDNRYFGTISNTELQTPLQVVDYSENDRPVEANATFYVGDAEKHIVECDNVWLYDNTKDKDFFIDLSQGTPITVDEGDWFWYVMDATDYEDPTKSIADAAQNVMTAVGEVGYDPTVTPNGTIPAPHGNAYRKTDLEWTIPLSGEGTLQADKDYVFVLAEAPAGTTAGTSVTTFAPSDLTELSVLHATFKPGHAPTP